MCRRLKKILSHWGWFDWLSSETLFWKWLGQIAWLNDNNLFFQCHLYHLKYLEKVVLFVARIIFGYNILFWDTRLIKSQNIHLKWVNKMKISEMDWRVIFYRQQKWIFIDWYTCNWSTIWRNEFYITFTYISS